MAYMRQVVTAGKIKEIKLYYTNKKKPKGEKRQKKKSATAEAVREQNRKNAEDKLRWLMCENFEGGKDLHITLKYDGLKNHIVTAEEMKNDIHKFCNKMRTALKKRGQEFKFIYVFGIGERSSRHFHMVLNCSDGALIQKIWNESATNTGRVNFEMLYLDGDFSALAKYFIKHSEKTFKVLNKWTGQRYHRSRNLRQPKIKREVITRSSTFLENPRVPKGWYLIDKYVESGEDCFGHKYFEYRIRQIC